MTMKPLDMIKTLTGRGLFSGRGITFKVLFIILTVLVLGIGIVMAYYLKSQNDTIRESKEIEIRQEAEILYTAIKNNMLAGEAPIAVELFRDFERGNFASTIGLYRKGGVSAFSDNSTLIEVNRNLGEDKFVPKIKFPEKRILEDSNFKNAVSVIEDVFIRDVAGQDKKIIIYKPLLNQPKCSTCHGIDHVVRGVITISAPVNDVYKMAERNIMKSMILYVILVIVLSSTIIIFLRYVIIGRILKVGDIVKGVGSGDFDTKIHVDARDEIGLLGNEINRMIDGLKERFRLTRFVSRSTLDHVRSDKEILPGGEKKTLTVLFSDIRNFTSYSESRDPEEVLEMLNRVMKLQSGVIHKYNGDIDKFVGDELMAVFEGEDMALRAVKAAVEIRNELRKAETVYDYPISVGIGLNTGEMISGNMGSSERIDRTVIGDAVNLGARLCSIAGRNTIVASEFTYDYIKNDVTAKEHEAIKVKGKDKRVKIYTIAGIK